MTTPIFLTVGDEWGSYGFGLELGAFNGRPTIWHDGPINGFNAGTEMFLDSGFAVEVLVNWDGANPVSIATRIITTVCNSATLSSNCDFEDLDCYSAICRFVANQEVARFWSSFRLEEWGRQ